jgi:hypothetical protein
MIKFSVMTPARRARIACALAVVCVGIIGTGFFIASSVAASGLPLPVITSSGPAAFTFTDAQADVSFKCALDSGPFAACESGIGYRRLTQGIHTFRVVAVSGSRTSGVGDYTWWVGGKAGPAAGPAAPRLTSYPSDPSADASPAFTFTDSSWPNVRFTCWLDSGKHQDCTGNATVEGKRQFKNVAAGMHCFSVYATSKSGRAGPAARYCWIIESDAAHGFAVGGSLTAPLYPGTSQPLDLTFTNPGSAPITIARGAVSASNITITTSAAGCASSNFTVAQGLTAAVTIRAHTTKPTPLSALGVPQADWPVIEMVETNSNQDACQGAKLTLTYSGIEANG